MVKTYANFDEWWQANDYQDLGNRTYNATLDAFNAGCAAAESVNRRKLQASDALAWALGEILDGDGLDDYWAMVNKKAVGAMRAALAAYREAKGE